VVGVVGKDGGSLPVGPTKGLGGDPKGFGVRTIRARRSLIGKAKRGCRTSFDQPQAPNLGPPLAWQGASLGGEAQSRQEVRRKAVKGSNTTDVLCH
jgi:hypothetical protein